MQLCYKLCFSYNSINHYQLNCICFPDPCLGERQHCQLSAWHTGGPTRLLVLLAALEPVPHPLCVQKEVHRLYPMVSGKQKRDCRTFCPSSQVDGMGRSLFLKLISAAEVTAWASRFAFAPHWEHVKFLFCLLYPESNIASWVWHNPLCTAEFLLWDILQGLIVLTLNVTVLQVPDFFSLTPTDVLTVFLELFLKAATVNLFSKLAG